MSALQPKHRRRGQATVEMSIVMVVLVPTFLYVLTADDLLRYRLNLQEVVVASPWDYTHLEYEPSSVAGNALVNNLQQRYINVNRGHSGGTVSKTQTGDKTAPMTFSSWDEKGAKRVECTKENIAGALGNSSQAASALSQEVNHGGLYICNAALGVSNVALINRFLQDWAGDVNVTDKQKGQTWGLNRQVFSVVADTWAMTRVEDVEPSGAGKQRTLYNRVDRIYSTHSNAASSSARQYVSSASQILTQIITQDSDSGNGDDTGTPEVGFSKKSSPATSANSGFDSSPWSHKGAASGTYQQAYSKRQNAYMGSQLK